MRLSVGPTGGGGGGGQHTHTYTQSWAGEGLVKLSDGQSGKDEIMLGGACWGQISAAEGQEEWWGGGDNTNLQSQTQAKKSFQHR